MRKTLVQAATLAAITVAVAVAAEKADKPKDCGKCPLSGGPAKESISVDYKGKKVYFCCNGCPGNFDKKNPEHVAKANHQLLVSGQMLQTGCPFSGGKINPDAVVEFEGVKVGFCCGNCKKKFEKAEDKFATVFADVKKGFTLQTKCPISGKPVDLAKSVEYEGKDVYFCCGGCPGAFEKDPEKFAAKLPKDEESDDEG